MLFFASNNYICVVYLSKDTIAQIIYGIAAYIKYVLKIQKITYYRKSVQFKTYNR